MARFVGASPSLWGLQNWVPTTEISNAPHQVWQSKQNTTNSLRGLCHNSNTQ